MYRTLVTLAALLVFVTTAFSRPSAMQPFSVGKDIYLNCTKYPNKDFVIKDVSIPDCKAPPCHFKRGDTAEIKFTLVQVAGGTYDKVYIAMCGEISILCANLALTKSSVCDLGADCPLKKGSSNDITVKVPISSSYPKIEVDAYLYVEKDSGDTDRKDELSCIDVDIQLD